MTDVDRVGVPERRMCNPHAHLYHSEWFTQMTVRRSRVVELESQFVEVKDRLKVTHSRSFADCFRRRIARSMVSERGDADRIRWFESDRPFQHSTLPGDQFLFRLRSAMVLRTEMRLLLLAAIERRVLDGFQPTGIERCHRRRLLQRLVRLVVHVCVCASTRSESETVNSSELVSVLMSSQCRSTQLNVRKMR